MATVIYNCKKCKKGKRVDYPIVKKTFSGTWFYRIDSTGKEVPYGAYIQASGGGKPTVYAGDTEAGLCPDCGRPMNWGVLKAQLAPEHKCDIRCTTARGHNCECSCGGANHGAAWR